MRQTIAARKTTCPYCGVGCGVVATPDGVGGAGIAGDAEHPANFGRLCSKGSALGETLSLEGRLLDPMLRTRGGGYESVSWDVALDRVAEGFAHTLKTHGPDALAFYLSGQLLTEDYYVANKLMKGFLGSANVDTNSRLCMASSVAGHRRAFGGDVVPGSYEDLDCADLLVLVGSNTAWCHPVLFQRMVKNRQERGAKIIVIDPRMTATCEDADLFLPIKPGMDSVLFAWLLCEIVARNALDQSFIDQHTNDFVEAVTRAREIAPDLNSVARSTGLTADSITAFCNLWIDTPRTVTAWSQGVNQSAQGTDKVDAMINCHLATGRIGRPGATPFSITGQPNAMGGREVGGLANMLAAQMSFTPDDIARVKTFWHAPAMAQHDGLKAVAMFDAIAEQRVRSLWVMATNPAVSLPRADHVRSALSKLDLFVVSEVVRSNDTLNSGAHVLLPASAWGEKDGTVTNSERRISRQRAFLDLPGQVRPDWWIVCEIAKRLGFADAFAFPNAAAIFREHAALSGFENKGTRAFDISAFDAVSDEDFEGLVPFQWPQARGDTKDHARLFGDGDFVTPDRRARFIAVEPPKLALDVSDEFPLMLNTGRIRDQWHTMTRTGKSPRLGMHIVEPLVTLHPKDAARKQIASGDFVRVLSASGEAVARAVLDEGQLRGHMFAPIHWNGETAPRARFGALVQDAVDPFSGQPELKATPVCIERVEYALGGTLFVRHDIELPSTFWWAKTAVTNGTAIFFACNEEPDALRALFTSLFDESDLADYSDAPTCRWHGAAFDGDVLQALMFVGRDHSRHVFENLRTIFCEPLTMAQRRLVLSGLNPSGIADQGPTVCACFGVGRVALEAAACSRAVLSVEDFGRTLKAGTNCGSCIPELRKILSACAAQ